MNQRQLIQGQLESLIYLLAASSMVTQETEAAGEDAMYLRSIELGAGEASSARCCYDLPIFLL